MTMNQTTKTDNHNPAAKLALRRYFLDKYHRQDPLRVLDCCQGSMKLWAALRAEYSIGEYLGVDLKAKHGRLKIDSVRILDQPGWDFNVIDVDTYGSPWKHWFALLKHAAQPVTIFLTSGIVRRGGGTIDHALTDILGLKFKTLEMTDALAVKLCKFADAAGLTFPSAHGLKIIECQEAENQGNARYLGLRLA